MTPYELTVFLHHAGSYSNFPGKSAPIYPPTIAMLMNEGLLANSKAPLPQLDDLCPLTATPKGQAFLSMLCGTPIPEIRHVAVLEYHDPRNSDWDWRRLDK